MTHPTSPIGAVGPVELRGDAGGRTFVPAQAPLIGLNYYDGRVLRADDLNLERAGQRRYVEFSNQAGGPGVVWGFELSGLDTAALALTPGLAIAPPGRVLHLPDGVRVPVADLLVGPGAAAAPPGPDPGFAPCVTAPTAAAGTAVDGITYHLVCLVAGVGLCGHAEVLGRPCDGGCVTATDRPFVVDGVTVVLRPLDPRLAPFTAPGVTTDAHRRSQVASALFAAEIRAGMGRDLLRSGPWGAGAPTRAGDEAVPIGVLGWNGSRITLLDMWTARRELMETPPRSYWTGLLEGRPWPAFLAQVLQFQNQLAEAPTPTAPTVPARILVERGFVTLPSAGYLPVDPLDPDLRRQVQDLMGPGVELRLCAVRRDQIPRELERAQHMERISLLRGLTDPAAVEQVDILVPDGTTETLAPPPTGLGFAVDLDLSRASDTSPERAADPATLRLRGAGRVDLGAAVDARLAVAGAATQGLLPLLGTLLGLFLGAGPRLDDLDGLRMRSTEAPPSVFRDAGRAVFAAAAQHRAGGTGRFAAPARRSDEQLVAARAELHVGADPFLLPVGRHTSFDLALEVVARAQATAGIAVAGRLTRLPGPAPDDGVRVAMSGVRTVTVTGVPGLAGGKDLVDGELVLRRRVSDGRTHLAVTDRESDATLGVAVAWSGPPFAARGLAAGRGDDPDSQVEPGPWWPFGGGVRAPVVLDATESPDIDRPGGTYHDTAVAALGMLVELHPDDPGYVGGQHARLFPPAPVAVTTAVRPTVDWVLFRRRSREECEGTAVPPTPVATVAVWVRRVTGPDEATRLREEIDAGRWPADGWERVDVVFAATGAALLTPAATWTAQYLVGGGAGLVAVARYAGPRQEIVGFARVTALLEALAPAAVRDPALVVDVAPPPPEDLRPAGTDGSAFLVTYDPAPDPGPGRLDVVGVVLSADEAAAILAGELPDGVDLAALGEGTSAAVDVEQVSGEARALLVRHGILSGHGKQLVAWVHPDADPAAFGAVTMAVLAELRDQPELTGLVQEPDPVRVAVDGGDLMARIFLLITPPGDG